MPVYRYIPDNVPCKLCGDGFDHRHSGTEAPLTSCPTCGQNVSREKISQVNTPKIAKPLSISDAKRAGFTVLKRISSGEFEKQ